jgi:hypothetical protein
MPADSKECFYCKDSKRSIKCFLEPEECKIYQQIKKKYTKEWISKNTYPRDVVDGIIDKLKHIEIVVATDKKGHKYELADTEELKKIIKEFVNLKNSIGMK